jgi:hypothetical protein
MQFSSQNGYRNYFIDLGMTYFSGRDLPESATNEERNLQAPSLPTFPLAPTGLLR